MTSIQIQTSTLAQLYDQDFCLWLEQTAQNLKDRNLTALDIENLIDEIEGMSKSQKSAIKSNLEVLLMHLLKYKYQPDKRSNSWRYTILEHRRRLDEAFETSPSLRRYFLERFENCYQAARKLASVETGIPIQTFSLELPFTIFQVLDQDFLPHE
jgi:Domain of unknown function DUF29